MLLKFEFSKEEVEERSIFAGDPPILVLVQKKQAKDKKKSYAPLLCERISQLIPSHPTLSVDTSFTRYKDVVRAYIKCKEHNKTSPVFYKYGDLKQGFPLSFEFKQTCLKCEANEEKVIDEELTVSNQNVDDGLGGLENKDDLIIRLPRIETPPLLSNFFKNYGYSVIAALNRNLGECSAAPDYELAVQNQRDTFGVELDRQWKLLILHFHVDLNIK